MLQTTRAKLKMVVERCIEPIRKQDFVAPTGQTCREEPHRKGGHVVEGEREEEVTVCINRKIMCRCKSETRGENDSTRHCF